VPTPESWPDILRKLRGSYSLSGREQIQPVAAALICFAFAVVLFRLSFERRGILPTALERDLLLTSCFLFGGLGLLLVFSYRMRYNFESGTLQVVLPGGYVFRQYNLETLKSVTRMKGKVVDSLTLYWENEVHRIQLPSSLISALSEGEGI
jgi:hypothetical protein